jgi:F-type H+-transporting ATPase subunit delta
MIGSSRASLEALTALVDGQQGAGGLDAAREIFGAADVLDGNRALLQSLTDSGLAGEVRGGAARDLLGSQFGATAATIVTKAAELRWSAARDLVTALDIAAARSAFAAAEVAGTLDTVEDELFFFTRTVVSDGQLQLALADLTQPAGFREGIVRDLTASRYSDTTVLLLVQVVRSPRGGESLLDTLEGLQQLAAARRGQVLAEVTSAIALTAEQTERLSAAISRIYGRPVRLNVVVDPTVVGGLSVRVGEELIDGTIATKLEQARRLVG